MTKANYGSIANNGLMTLNGHVLCSIDTETTGLRAGYHDIVEVAVVPLDAQLRPMNILPFHTTIRPKDRYADSWTEEAAKAHGHKREDLMLHGVEAFKAADLFEAWVNKLELAPYKKIAPLGKNWGFDRGFLEDWLGPKTFNGIFWHRARDLSPVVHFLNDQAEFDGLKPPFPQTDQENIRGRLKIPTRKAHRAIDDALTLAECYRAIVRREFPWSDSEGA